MVQKVIGVTGTIGTGKSTVSRMLKSFGKKGVLVLDADKIAKKFLKKGSDSSKMLAQMFPDVVDKKGFIDSKKLADVVFESKSKLSMLNGLIHPFVIRSVKQKLEKLKEKFVVLDVPLLIEADMLGIVDVLIIVNAEKTAVIKRSKFPKKELEKRLSHQMSFEKKKEEAVKKLGKDKVFIINNSLDIRKTKDQLKSVWQKISLK